MDQKIAVGYQGQVKMRSIVFFLVPHFTMLPFSAAIETLRIANRTLGYSAYTWRFGAPRRCSVCQKPIDHDLLNFQAFRLLSEGAKGSSPIKRTSPLRDGRWPPKQHIDWF